MLPSFPSLTKSSISSGRIAWSIRVERILNSDPVIGREKTSGKMITSSSLNQLVASAYAWRWLMTKDPNRLTQADTLFKAGVLGAGNNCHACVTYQDYSFTGKEFSQNYKSSFDFVRYRSGNPKSTVF